MKEGNTKKSFPLAPSAPGAEKLHRFSRRSQASIKRENALEGKLKTCERLIQAEERKLQTSEVNRKRQQSQVVSGQGFFQRALDSTLTEIAEGQRRLAGLEGERAELITQIEAFTPTSLAASARDSKQQSVARLVKARVEKVMEIDAMRERLFVLLNEYGALTQSMLRLLRELDFTVTGDLDLSRFEKLLAAVPSAMHAESVRWMKCFLGLDERRPHRITHEFDVFPETLAAANFYKRGDTAMLTADEKKKADYDPPRELTPWEIDQQAQTPKPAAGLQPRPVF